MLTPKIVEEAIRTSHKACKKNDRCIHAEAMATHMRTIMERVSNNRSVALDDDPGGYIQVFSDAIHIGYRMRELEEEEMYRDLDSSCGQ